MLVGMLPISVLSVGAESGSENAVGAPRGSAQVSASAYPKLTNLVEGTEIIYGYVYFFYKNGKVESFNSTTDPVTVQLFKSGSSAAAYSTTVKGNSASYTISGVAPGCSSM